MANNLRKRALRDGTYGAFSLETGEGWDPAWDAGLLAPRRRLPGGAAPASPGKAIEAAGGEAGSAQGEEVAADGGGGNWCRYRVTAPKLTKRQRTREERAAAIDRTLVDMDRRIEEHHAARHASKPPDTFENRYKKLMRVKK
jgi:hypothetical protein